MGKKETGKKSGKKAGEKSGKKAGLERVARYERLQARNDFALATIRFETSKAEALIDWEAVSQAAEVIACDACSHDDDSADGMKDVGEVIIRSIAECSFLVELSARFEGRANLGWAAEATLSGLEGEFRDSFQILRAALVTS